MGIVQPVCPAELHPRISISSLEAHRALAVPQPTKPRFEAHTPGILNSTGSGLGPDVATRMNPLSISETVGGSSGGMSGNA